LLVFVIAVSLLWNTGDGFVDRAAYWGLQCRDFLELNQYLAHIQAPIWLNVTCLGDLSVILLVLSPLVITHPQAWASMLASIPIGGMSSVLIKHLTLVPRPAAVLDHSSFNMIGGMLRGHNSFPSGHSIAAFGAAAAILATCFARPRSMNNWTWITVIILAAAVVAVSRIAVGAHWPLDVAAGAALGWAAGLTGAGFARNRQAWWKKWSQDSFARYLLGVALIALSLSVIYRMAHEGMYIPVYIMSSMTGLLVSLWLLCKYPVQTYLDRS